MDRLPTALPPSAVVLSLDGMMTLRDNPLAGRVALVTGASSGVGWATALAFARVGMRVAVTARRADRLEKLAATIRDGGGEAIAIVGDAGEYETATRAVERCRAELGGIHTLINNAGQGNYKQLVDTSVEEYDQLMHANMRSSFVFSRAAAPYLIEQRAGNIVFVSSVAGLKGTGNEAVYSASKFAQVGFAQALDEELRPYGVKVGTLCPGGIKTEFAVGQGRTEQGVRESLMMDAADVAEAIVFLCAQPANVRILEATIRNMGPQK